ncbi:protein argonaute 12-like [Coffea eugenioides]|uniref:protein argonaute 12-like n=1 Tax=Coffea eugenioides TaxID=49369 RepID=UPI000F60F0B1|nr:protein argonaute 12-like [Coffea eugenioides]
MEDFDIKFNVMVSLFNWMQKSKSSSMKRSKFRKFLNAFCRKPGDYFSAIRGVAGRGGRAGERAGEGVAQGRWREKLGKGQGMSGGGRVAGEAGEKRGNLGTILAPSAGWREEGVALGKGHECGGVAGRGGYAARGVGVIRQLETRARANAAGGRREWRRSCGNQGNGGPWAVREGRRVTRRSSTGKGRGWPGKKPGENAGPVAGVVEAECAEKLGKKAGLARRRRFMLGRGIKRQRGSAREGGRQRWQEGERA